MHRKVGLFHWPSAVIALICAFFVSLAHGLADSYNGYIVVGGMASGTLLWATLIYIPVRAVLPPALDALFKWLDGRRARKQQSRARDISDHFK